MRSNQNTGKMYMIKSQKNFLNDLVVDQNLTRPKDDFWSYLNRSCEILFVWDDRMTVNMNPCDLVTIIVIINIKKQHRTEHDLRLQPTNQSIICQQIDEQVELISKINCGILTNEKKDIVSRIFNDNNIFIMIILILFSYQNIDTIIDCTLYTA